MAAAPLATYVVADTQPTGESAILGLPPEMRLIIYGNVEDLQQQAKDSRYFGHGNRRINNQILVSRLHHHRAGLSAFSRTCKFVDGEVHELFCDSTIKLRMFGSIHGLSLSRLDKELPLRHGLESLRHVGSMHIDFELTYVPHPSIAVQVQSLEDIIQVLKQSKNLRAVTFDPHAAGLDPNNYFGLKKASIKLGRKNTRDGAKAGRTMKERELDYAQVLVGTLRDMLSGGEYGTTDSEFFHILREGHWDPAELL